MEIGVCRGVQEQLGACKLGCAKGTREIRVCKLGFAKGARAITVWKGGFAKGELRNGFPNVPRPFRGLRAGSVPTWKRRMSRGFPAFFRQFWLHLRKNLRKNLGWEKINSGCTSKSGGSQRPPPRPWEHSRAECPHCLGVPSWRWHHECHIMHQSARCPLHPPTCDTRVGAQTHTWGHGPTRGDTATSWGTQPHTWGHAGCVPRTPPPQNVPGWGVPAHTWVHTRTPTPSTFGHRGDTRCPQPGDTPQCMGTLCGHTRGHGDTHPAHVRLTRIR